MTRYLEVRLEKRDVRCVARLLDDKAPRTCEAIWNALPLGGQAYHAKYARNEIYALVPSFADPEPVYVVIGLLPSPAAERRECSLPPTVSASPIGPPFSRGVRK